MRIKLMSKQFVSHLFARNFIILSMTVTYRRHANLSTDNIDKKNTCFESYTLNKVAYGGFLSVALIRVIHINKQSGPT